MRLRFGGSGAIMDRRVEEVRSNFAAQAKQYDVQIRKMIPRYDEMLDSLVSCLPPGKGGRVVDLGCGTAALSKKFLDSHPDAELTCVDMTEGMLDLARVRMAGHPNVRFVLADFHELDLGGPYDHVITSLALHHVVTDEDKRMIYRKIFDALAPGGSFFNADLVLGSDREMQDIYMEKWKSFLYQNFTRSEVEDGVLQRHRREDRPAKLTDHLRWLAEAGFVGTDVAWKHWNFAVYGGKKE
jgi:tRNA (cmo5U34)-methyltransferase